MKKRGGMLVRFFGEKRFELRGINDDCLVEDSFPRKTMESCSMVAEKKVKPTLAVIASLEIVT